MYLESQNIRYTDWGLWQNHVALFCIMLGFFLLAYVQLRRIPKYKWVIRVCVSSICCDNICVFGSLPFYPNGELTNSRTFMTEFYLISKGYQFFSSDILSNYSTAGWSYFCWSAIFGPDNLQGIPCKLVMISQVLLFKIDVVVKVGCLYTPGKMVREDFFGLFHYNLWCHTSSSVKTLLY